MFASMCIILMIVIRFVDEIFNLEWKTDGMVRIHYAS